MEQAVASKARIAEREKRGKGKRQAASAVDDEVTDEEEDGDRDVGSIEFTIDSLTHDDNDNGKQSGLKENVMSVMSELSQFIEYQQKRRTAVFLD